MAHAAATSLTLKDRSPDDTSVQIHLEGMHYVSDVQVVGVKLCPFAPGREDKYPQMILVLRRQYIVLMETCS